MSYNFESIYFDDPIIPGRVMDIFRPKKITRNTAIFLVHGGGWRGGARGDFHNLLQAFRNEGFLCAATDYRLADVNILDQIMDVRHGYDLFHAYLKKQGRPSRIFVHGASAGAHLAAILALAKPGECGEPSIFHDYDYQQPWTAPVGALLQATPTTFEPWDDIFPLIWASMQDIVGVPYDETPEAYRRVSPIEYVNNESCPVFLLEAENEHMFPLNLNLRFIEKMKGQGRRAEHKIYTKAEHGFFYDVIRRQQKEAMRDTLQFIESIDTA